MMPYLNDMQMAQGIASGFLFMFHDFSFTFFTQGEMN
jgi:hypothetical protein